MKSSLVLFVCFLVAGISAQAAITINISQIGSDVVATGSGSINTAGLTLNGQNNWDALIEVDWGVTTGGDSPFALPVDVWKGISGPSAVGSLVAAATADTFSGDRFGVFFGYGNDSILVEQGYVSGTALSGTATWEAQSFADFGLSEGTYEWTWGSGGTADSATINVTAVPEPATAGLLVGAGLVIAAYRRVRKSYGIQ